MSGGLERDEDGDRGDEQRHERAGRGGAVAVRVLVVVFARRAVARRTVFRAAGSGLHNGELEAVGLGIRHFGAFFVALCTGFGAIEE